MADAPLDLDAVGQAELLRRGELSPGELVRMAIDRIERLNGELNAVVTPMYEEAVAAAGRCRPGSAPFAGVPMLVKDLLARVKGVRLTEGSVALANHVAADDSELVVRLRRAGFILLGKTNTSELGATPVTESRLFGPARNPWDPSRTPGGSSGGSAVAVATGMTAIAHGNDGGGSLRTPASCCGVFGFKPSRGRNPLGPEYGDLYARVIAEHALTRSVRDSAALLDATAGALPGADYAAGPPDVPFARAAAERPPRLRIAVSERPIVDVPVDPDCSAALAATVALCTELGHDVVEAAPALDAERLMDAWFGIWAEAMAWGVAMTEMRTGHPPWEDYFEPLTWQYFERGRAVPALEHLRRLERLAEASAAIADHLSRHDVWLTPTLAQPPIPLGGFYDGEGIERYLRFAPYTRLANIAGTPAMSVPLWWSEQGLPIGTHFMAAHGREAVLFQLAAELETARPWAGRLPPPRGATTTTGGRST
jgi:amidase